VIEGPTEGKNIAIPQIRRGVAGTGGWPDGLVAEEPGPDSLALAATWITAAELAGISKRAPEERKNVCFPLRQNVFHNMTMHIGEPEMAALVLIGKLLMVDS
jgi:hypothetical protein